MTEEFNWREVVTGGWIDNTAEEVDVALNHRSMNSQIKDALEAAFMRIFALEKRPDVNSEFLYAIAESHTADLNNRITELEARLAALEAKPAEPTAQPADTVTISKWNYEVAVRELRTAISMIEPIAELEIEDHLKAALSNLDTTYHAEPPF